MPEDSTGSVHYVAIPHLGVDVLTECGIETRTFYRDEDNQQIIGLKGSPAVQTVCTWDLTQVNCEKCRFIHGGEQVSDVLTVLVVSTGSSSLADISDFQLRTDLAQHDRLTLWADALHELADRLLDEAHQLRTGNVDQT